MSEITPKTKRPTKVDRKNWFNDFIASVVHNIRVDELALKTNTASEAKVKLYDSLISGNQDDLYDINRELVTQHFAAKITIAYLEEVLKSMGSNKPIKLALRLTNSKILVWAEIDDDDEEIEDTLILSEAKINAQFCDKGYHISSTIVEANDKLEIPPHYTMVMPVIIEA